jgi:hypothetical protein
MLIIFPIIVYIKNHTAMDAPEPLAEKISQIKKNIEEIDKELKNKELLSSHQIKVFKQRRASLNHKLKVYQSWK